eukprot:TRINITY_DN44811_c0_g1_i1.p1 TRINITY_DN44811_c0_g1~~TRINITY_DN44811_c0_g1_i1.p1  ORF type:complete len:541 (-),score=124.06 TRINITY_DN44811_c0_g1_i1:46-1668(-)
MRQLWRGVLVLAYCTHEGGAGTGSAPADDLKRVDAAAVMQDARTAKNIEAFQKWASSCGINARARLGLTPGMGLGVLATAAMDRHEVYAEIPLRCAMCVETAENSTHLKPVFETLRKQMRLENGRPFGHNPQAMDAAWALIFILLAERALGKGSFYAPYLAVLPRKIDTPFFFSTEERAALKGTGLDLDGSLDNMEDEYKKRYKMFKHIADMFPKDYPPEKAGWGQFVWAASIVDSRAVPIGRDDGGFPGMLLPVADMENMNASWTVKYHLEGGAKHPYQFKADKETVEVLTEAPVVKDGQIWTSYYKANSLLLRRHGFVLRSNANDEISLKVNHTYARLTGREATEKNKKADNWGMREPLLRRLGYDELTAGTYSIGPGFPDQHGSYASSPAAAGPLKKHVGRWVDPSLLRLLRIVYADEKDLEDKLFNVWQSNQQKRSNEEDEVKLIYAERGSKELEEKVKARVKALCEERLAAYPTTLKEDNDLLAAHDKAAARGDKGAVLQLRMLWAVTYRREEKLILQKTIKKMSAAKSSRRSEL